MGRGHASTPPGLTLADPPNPAHSRHRGDNEMKAGGVSGIFTPTTPPKRLGEPP